MNEWLSLPPLAWLANYLLHSTVLLGSVWLLDVTGVLRDNRTREFAWRVALAGALVTATLHTFLPGISLSGEPRLPMLSVVGNPQITEQTNAITNTAAQVSEPHVAPMPVKPPVGAAPQSRIPALEIPMALLLLTLWAGGALLLLLRLARTAQLAFRELVDRETVTHGRLHEQLLGLCAKLPQDEGSMCAPRLAIVDDLPGPVTLPNGEICLPRWAVEQLDRQQLDAMLAHELAHVRHRDPLLLLAVTVIEALLFVQPLNRIAHRRLANLAELNADAFAARITGNSRALAEALAQCAKKLQEQPVSHRSLRVGVAMATRRSPVIQRVERLLGGITMQDRKVSRLAPTLGVIALLVTVLLLPAFGAREAEARTGVLIGTSVHEDDAGNMTFEIGRPGYFLHVETDGKIGFTPDDTDVAFVEKGARLEIREKSDGTLHELVVTNEAGELERRYSRDRKSMAFDTEAREWLARVIPEVLRNTAIDAERRVARLHSEGGMPAVLAEMKRIESSHAIGRYAAVIIENHKLEADELQQLLKLLGDIGSDFELRQALTRIIETQTLDAGSQVQLMNAASSIGSDFEAAELVSLVTPKLELTDATLKAWNSLVADIGSDFEQRRALSTVFEHHALPKAWKIAALEAARAGIGSDFELRSLLETAAEHVGNDADLVREYIAAFGEIGSDFEAREAVVVLVNKAELDDAGYSRLLDALDDIGSDFEALQALLAIAESMPREPALLAKYRSIARDLSRHEREQAENAID